MKLIHTSAQFGTRIYHTLEEYATNELHNIPLSRRCETAEATTISARENSRAIGCLLDILAHKNLLTAEEVVLIVEGYLGPQTALELKE